MLKFRDLTANDVYVRANRITEDGVTLLIYKDARVDMDILDETVGPEHWQREHYDCKGSLFCRVGIEIGNNFVWKSDCGAESNTEAEKGEASDSFKRACFCWGIGRELYTAPLTFIPASRCRIKERNGKLTCVDKFAVSKMNVSDGKITELEIVNNGMGGDVCFYWKDGQNRKPEQQKPKTDKASLDNAKNTIVQTGEHAGKTLEWVYKNDPKAINKIYIDSGEYPEVVKAIETIAAEIKRKRDESNG